MSDTFSRYHIVHYTDCPPMKLLLLSEEELKEAIEALGQQRRYTEVLLVELLEDDEDPPESAGACASTPKKTSDSYTSSTPIYPAYKQKGDRISDQNSAQYALPNRGALRDVEDFLTKKANLQLRPVSVNFDIKGIWV